MIHLEVIHPLTDFARNTKAYAKKLKKTGRPAILTVNGRAEFVVQDAQSYQQLLNIAYQYAEDRKLDQALADVEAGRVYAFEEVVENLKIKHFGKTER
ncbi:MAG: type II toxin-antitoxin system Phd/YefM family antitoxin [Bdellovibrionales bacterium]